MFEFPNININRIAIKLNAKAERMVKKGHPWIFDQSIIKQSPGGKAGDLAIVFDEKKNKFLAVGLYDPYSPIRVKLLQFHLKAEIGKDWFKDKITQAYRKRESLLETDTNSYRLLFGENDSFPGMIVDVYDHVLVLKLYSTVWLPYLNEIVPILHEVSGTECGVMRMSRNVMSQVDLGALTDGMVIYGSLKTEEVLFKEHGIFFHANVVHGHKTGFFLDHRANRKLVGEMSMGKEVLDVFSYAGGFSVHALVGGAAKVTSLDISKQALHLASANVSLNQDRIIGIHECIAQDAFEALQEMKKQGRKFDLVIIDPPSFAKSAKEILSAITSYRRLAKLGIGLTNNNGRLLLASCSSRIGSEEFFETNESVLRNEGSKFKLQMKTFHDVDHPIGFEQGKYLKAGYYWI